jgi:adenosylcobinamide-GDP ribazoletransferase
VRARRAIAGAGLALGLLTIVPVRTRIEPAGLGAAAPWFPCVGALVGAGAAGVVLAADGALGSTVAGVLAVIWLIVATGALHVDGLADCADALGVRGGRARRLAVMRESTIGVFGTLAVVLYALLLAAAIAALPEDDVLPTLVAAGALGRWGAVVHAAVAPPARPEGLGAAFSVGSVALVVATVIAFAVAIGVAGVEGLAAAAAALVVTGAITSCAVRGLGGRTGDTLGATIVLGELVATLCMLGM